jgi:predicted RNA binding protein YcfA (HicA-like mRNA interferase family)
LPCSIDYDTKNLRIKKNMPKDNKKESLKQDLIDFSRPILWRDFVKTSKSFGYKIVNRTGSLRVFVHPKGERFTVHEPHGRDRWVHKNDRSAMWKSLERLEVLNEEES